MISIVVCSADEKRFRNFSENINLTIGLPFELIRIDNSRGKYGICNAYNEGTRVAKYAIICFLHEDIHFETPDWGTVLTKIYENPWTGMVGVAGSCYYGLPPIGWFNLNEIECNYIQEWGDQREPLHRRLDRFPGTTEADVVVMDGIFISCRKSLAEKYPFDAKHFPGFHGYDIDLSLQLQDVTRKVVTKNILVRHSSEGSLDPSWFQSMRRISRKWKDRLPVSTELYTKKELDDLKMESLEVFFYFSSRYLGRLKRSRLYFYYALKLGKFRPALAYYLNRASRKLLKRT